MAKEPIRQQPIYAPTHRPAASKTIQQDERSHDREAHIDHEQIAVRAHELWERRGRPIGSPEEDWYRAERELTSRSDRAA